MLRYRHLVIKLGWFLLLLSCSNIGAVNHAVEETCLSLDGSTDNDCVAAQIDRNAASNKEKSNLQLNELPLYGDDIGIKQTFDLSGGEGGLQALEKARRYLQDVVFRDAYYEPIRADCKNQHDSCAFWASIGECDKNADYMKLYCAPVCQSCDYYMASRQQLLKNRKTTNYTAEQLAVGEDMGVPQKSFYPDKSEIETVIQAARNYLDNVILTDHDLAELYDVCKNEEALCAQWAVDGFCQNNPKYMKISCGPVCQSCEHRLKEVRCPLDPNAVDAYGPGDLHRMFEFITTDPNYLSHFQPNTLSRPELLPGDTMETAPYKVGPWVVTLENFLSQDEAIRLIELGAEIGYKQSGKQGHLKADGTYDTYYDEGRTSTSAWCSEKCLEDPISKIVTEKITNLTGVPEPNLEFLQILKYDVGQLYQTHHDFMPHHVRRQPGGRILTVFLYLSDVEEGGGTNFPLLNVTVVPKLGRVLMWPNVLDEDPNLEDARTEHQALPVIKGVKYATNAWVHLRDFKNAFYAGCE